MWLRNVNGYRGGKRDTTFQTGGTGGNRNRGSSREGGGRRRRDGVGQTGVKTQGRRDTATNRGNRTATRNNVRLTNINSYRGGKRDKTFWTG